MQGRRRIAEALIAALCLVGAGAGEGNAQTPLTPIGIHVKKTGNPYIPGERLTYAVRWMKLPVGEAVVEVSEGTLNDRKVYIATTSTRSSRLIRWIYKVDDRVVTYVDKETLLPLKYEQHLREGRKKRDVTIIFDWKKKKAYSFRWVQGALRKQREVPLKAPSRIDDPLSCLFTLRTLDFSGGKKVDMYVADRKRVWHATLEVVKKCKMRLRGLGTFKVMRIKPSAEFEGLFVHDKEMTLWLDEESGVPVKMIAKIPIGSVAVILKKVELPKKQ